MSFSSFGTIKLPAAAALSILVLTAGCPDDEPADEPDTGIIDEDADPTTDTEDAGSSDDTDTDAPPALEFDIEQLVDDLQSNFDAVGMQVADSIDYYNTADAFDDVNRELDLESEFCSSTAAAPWHDIHICRELPTGTDLRGRIGELNDDVIAHVFTDENLADETSTSLMFELDGEATCSDTDCANWVDDQQLELEASSPHEGDYDIAATVGAADAEPVDFQVYRQHVAADVDLAELADAFSSMEPDRTMPEQVDGEIRLAVDTADDTSVLRVDVVSQVQIADGDFELSIEPGTEVIEIELNNTDQSVGAAIDLGSVYLQYLDSSYDPDAGQVTDSLVQFELPGATTDVRIEDASTRAVVDGLTFGDEPARVLFDGDVEAELTLNPDEGEQFHGTVDWSDEFTVRVDPTFDTALDMKFQRIRRLGVDVYDWMSDETLRARFADATEPTLRYADEVLEVLAGELTLESETSDDIVIQQNQCLSGGTWTPHPYTTFSVDPC